ncbi:uncharacterized protein LOC115754776 [Rhodamnia argentea]|uniref:Uncharacterized protein LOC115754776 n=1 Tax=Rhodamnia argentea TaxID=178133 RepID=A0A8B8QTS7_9MYRT|nr:uncharacterized protein LOC115754776 [Rhodamnia argentea]
MMAKISYVFLILLVSVESSMQQVVPVGSVYCLTGTRCQWQAIPCPEECPYPLTMNKACYVDCDSPTCSSQCRQRRPNCQGIGSACYDPRFIGGDGIVFYFHGKKDQTFSLVSDTNLQLNARFIGHRPTGRSRDNTWIQALGILFNSQSFTMEATRAETWDDQIDHLIFSHNGNEIEIPQYSMSTWYSEANDTKVERISSKNSVSVTLKGGVEIMVNVVPITKEEDRIHRYMLPSDDCFAHLEVQFRFSGLSPKVEGVLGRTYQPNFANPAKPGVAMPVVGGEDKYRTTSLLSADCKLCIFAPGSDRDDRESSLATNQYVTLDCTRGVSTGSGHGIVCKK